MSFADYVRRLSVEDWVKLQDLTVDPWTIFDPQNTVPAWIRALPVDDKLRIHAHDPGEPCDFCQNVWPTRKWLLGAKS